MSGSDLVDWIRLSRTDGLGPVGIRNLLARTGSAAAALAQLPEMASRAGRKSRLVPYGEADARRDLETAAGMGITAIARNDPRYPVPLNEIEDAPTVLWVKGAAEKLSKPCIAVVGARNASLNGRKIAKAWSAELAEAGYTVVSGLARGFDGAAHEGAVTKGKTVAVMAGGIDVIYPPEHRDLWARVAETGAVISEMVVGTEPLPAYFPRRNRIISGLSLAIIVVEATLKSGSLITARLAADQGRDILAVPGSPLDPRAQGPNSLIRDGATLVQSVDDILGALNVPAIARSRPSSNTSKANQPIEKIDEKALEPLRDRALALIGAQPVLVDELVRQCQTSAPILAQVLLDLELAGQIERLPGNKVAGLGKV